MKILVERRICNLVFMTLLWLMKFEIFVKYNLTKCAFSKALFLMFFNLLIACSGVGAFLTDTAALEDSASNGPKGIRWWSLHRTVTSHINTQHMRPFFTNHQWGLFTSKRCNVFDEELLRSALRGMQEGLQECSRQMQKERWNCSMLLLNNNFGSIFGRLLWKGSPEAAFVYSIVSAAITKTVAAECQRKLSCCPCRTQRREDPRRLFNWAQCDHNVHFARNFAKHLMDKVETGSDLRFMTILHNYNTGRRIVKETMANKCTCHGTSGTCATKTCWKHVSSMERIGSILKRKFSNSKRVIQGNNALPFESYGVTQQEMEVRSRSRVKARPNRRRLNLLLSDSPHRLPRHPSRSALVHYEILPEKFFCERNSYWGVAGTRGRICNMTSSDNDNCNKLCCGRGHSTEIYVTVERCRCKFIWCCKVHCESCRVERKREICN